MVVKSRWLLQRALPVMMLITMPHFTFSNEFNHGTELSGEGGGTGSIYRVPFNSWAGKRSRFERSRFTEAEVKALMEKLRSIFAQNQEEEDERLFEHKRAPFNSWAGKRAPFNSWAGKRAPFSSWAGKRAPFSSWAGKRTSSEELRDENLPGTHGDIRFGDNSQSHRVKRSSEEYSDAQSGVQRGNSRNSHARVARQAAQSRNLQRRVRSNTAFSAWGGK